MFTHQERHDATVTELPHYKAYFLLGDQMGQGMDFSWRAVDLSGQRFGRLTVLRKGWLEVTKWRGQRQTKWECECDCGKCVEVYASNLRKGTTRSCGCLQKEIAKEIAKRNLVRKEREDLTNRIFGRLTVTGIGTRKDARIHYWVTQCECGSVQEVRADKLKLGATKSCGCLRKELGKSIAAKARKSKKPAKAKDLTGKRFGKLVVQLRVNGTNPIKWECLCDCGYPATVRGGNLKSGRTKSCGCLRRTSKKGSQQC